MTSEARWSGEWGTKYAQFFVLEPPELDAHWQKTWGIPRSAIVIPALRGIPRTAGVLEVGCGTGNQLAMLRIHGFADLTGLDINLWAANKARERGFDAMAGTAQELPFPPKSFDLVYTCGVLSHLETEKAARAVNEILRVAKRWIWITEYVNNSGNGEFMFPADWKRIFGDLDPSLTLRYGPKLLQSLGAGDMESFLFEREVDHAASCK